MIVGEFVGELFDVISNPEIFDPNGDVRGV